MSSQSKSSTLPRSSQEWRNYFQTEEGRNQLNSVRSLLDNFGSHGLPIEEIFLTKGYDPVRMTAALTELVHLGELEASKPDQPGGEWPRTFVRRKLS